MVLRIEQAIARAKEQGRKIRKKDISLALWPEGSEASRIINMGRLCNGTTRRIEPEWLVKISEITGVSVEFLLGTSNE